ncbi:MAG TPA: rhomboid family intramembrane serine protease [Nocardioides sp.]|nr:rhomboid family intramembrane serine protease [Nocardioides sp.]
MRDAAVGFHCPTCIAEGAKTTRSARTPYGGTRTANPALSSMVLIGMNVAVWLAIVATGWKDSRLIDRLALLPVGRCGSDASPGSYYNLTNEGPCIRFTDGDGNWFPGVSDGSYWQLVTSGFAHVEVWHIGFNMVALWFLGPQLEAVLGRTRFLALYFISLLSGAALVYWLAGESSATLGASGAIFGLLGALLVVAYKVGGDVRALMVWLGLNVAITFLFPGVSWQGHLGGFVGGFLVGAVLVYAPRTRRTTVQTAGLSVLVVAVLVAIVARTAVLA